MKNITIVYGSTTGSTQTVAQWIEGVLSEKGASVKLLDASGTKADATQDADLILLGASTWGEGDIQDDFVDFYDAMDKVHFDGRKVAVFGCGDSAMFPHVFCEAVTQIEQKASECGAHVIAESLRVDGLVDDYESAVKQWAEALL